MGVEIEAKMRVADAGMLEERIRELAGEPMAVRIQRDTYLDTPGNDLRKIDAGMRVRVVFAPGDETNATSVVTYKGAREPGPIKRREEIEFSVGDPAGALTLMHRLGFVERLSFEKRRTSWRLGGCQVELDHVAVLGDFVEIEGPDDASVMSVREQLGLGEAEMLTDGYARMLATELEARGIEERRLVLDAPAE